MEFRPPDQICDNAPEWLARSLRFYPMGLTQSLCESDRCAAVWRAIERRLTGDEERDQFAFDFLWALAEAHAWPYSLEAKLSAAERIKKATRISRLAHELHEELLPLCAPPARVLPDEFMSPLFQRAYIEARQSNRSEKHGPSRYPDRDDDPTLRNDSVDSEHPDPDCASIDDAYESGFEQSVRAIVSYVEVIAEGALVWGKVPPIVPRPNGQNADRLYFIRKMTSFFKCELGTPMRAHVLTLTALYFPCDDLDVSAIAKLAP